MKTELLIKAIRVALAAPEDKFDLNEIRVNTSCGTVCCALGWIGSDPDFQIAGFEVDEYASMFVFGDRYRPKNFRQAAARFFQITEAEAVNLFSPAEESVYDYLTKDGISDKELFRFRCQQFFKEKRIENALD